MLENTFKITSTRASRVS